jgi:hypothetical protein
MPLAYGHHGHHHHDSSPPGGGSPTLPAVTSVPPIPPLPPPPVAPGILAPITFQIPTFVQPSMALPTDLSGIGAGVDVNAMAGVLSKPDVQSPIVMNRPDVRFQFIGSEPENWILFNSDYPVTDAMGASNCYKQSEVSDGSPPQTLKKLRISKTVGKDQNFDEPAFLPTVLASVTKLTEDHVALHSGAVLVRAGNRPVLVSTKVNGHTVFAKVSGGAIALISTFDGKPTVLNLTDKCCGAVKVYVPGAADTLQTVSLNAGQIAEIYDLRVKPTGNLVATKIDCNKVVSADCGLMVCTCHYVRALKQFNLVAALPQPYMNRILKTAAALCYSRR